MYIVIFISCETNYSDKILTIDRKLVVDGWIENNRYPIVMLTYNTPYFSNLDSSSFRNLIASRAKVIVTDGEQTEILTLTRDNNYFPPFVYKGYHIKGEIGKKYLLYIEDETDTVIAETSIPLLPEIDSLWFEFNNDTSGIIKGIIIDNANEKNYYRVFTKIKNKDKRYYPVLMPTFDDKYFNGKSFTFYLNKGPQTYLKPIVDIEFKKNDTISVRITCIEEQSYKFWRAYDEEVLNAGNPFASNIKGLPGNVYNGLGIWCGYAAIYSIIIAK